MGGHVVLQIQVVEGRTMLSPRRSLYGGRQIPLGRDVNAVGFVVSHKEVEFVAYCVFTYVLEVGEELMVFLWEEMKGGLIEHIPCH